MIEIRQRRYRQVNRPYTITLEAKHEDGQWFVTSKNQSAATGACNVDFDTAIRIAKANALTALAGAIRFGEVSVNTDSVIFVVV